MNNYEMKHKADFILGYVDDEAEPTKDKLTFEYKWQTDISQSFTGTDLLYCRLKTGNVADHFVDKAQGTYLTAAKSGSGELKVDKLWYEFVPCENVKAWVGPRIENYYMVGTEASCYNEVTKQFKEGPNGSAYGSSTSPGLGAAYTKENEDGSKMTFSLGYCSRDGTNSTKGMLDEDARTKLLGQIGYQTDDMNLSLAMANNNNGGFTGYFHTTGGKIDTIGTDETAYALRACLKPSLFGCDIGATVQLGFDFSTIDNAATNAPKETQGWMMGVTFDNVGGNEAGFAVGNRQHATKYNGTGNDQSADNLVYELWYDYKLNDSVSLCPAYFGGSDVETAGKDISGMVLLTKFRN